MSTALDEAIKFAGGQTQLARAIGVKQGHIWTWLNRDGGRVPLDRVAAVERATEGQVRSEDLRPDVRWLRDESGDVTGYQVQVEPAAKQPSGDPAKVA